MEIKAVNKKYNLSNIKHKVFLGGAIDNGSAEDWQKKLVDILDREDILLFNPRRSDWNSNWSPVAENKEFAEQVNWELDHIELSEINIFYFPEHSKAPITLLELGLCLARKPEKTFVFCHPNFYRVGNVEITTNRYKGNFFTNLEDFLNRLKEELK